MPLICLFQCMCLKVLELFSVIGAWSNQYISDVYDTLFNKQSITITKSYAVCTIH